MFAIRQRPWSVTQAASKFFPRALLSRSTTAETARATSPTAPQSTVFDFDQPTQMPQPFAYPAEEAPPTGRGYPIRTGNPFFSKPPSQRSSLRYRLHCRSTRNNTIVQFTEPNGRSLAWFSGGSLKFKGVNRASYEAGYQCAVAVFKVIKQVVKEKGDIQVEIYFKGFGQGREAMKTALVAAEGVAVRNLVSLVQDRTPIKIGGTRAPKARRL